MAKITSHKIGCHCSLSKMSGWARIDRATPTANQNAATSRIMRRQNGSCNTLNSSREARCALKAWVLAFKPSVSMGPAGPQDIWLNQTTMLWLCLQQEKIDLEPSDWFRAVQLQGRCI